MQSHIIHTFFMMFLFTCFVSSSKLPQSNQNKLALTPSAASALMIGNAHIEPKSRMSPRTTPLDLKDEGSVLSPTEQAQVANVTAEHAQLVSLSFEASSHNLLILMPRSLGPQ